MELKKEDFYSSINKKRRYWPTNVLGEDVKDCFVDQNVEGIQYCHGKLDEVQFHLHCIKELDYTRSLMSTYRTMEKFGEEKNCSRKEDRHIMVNDHNARSQSLISLEESQTTRRWSNRAFAFILGVSEVNTMLAETYFSAVTHNFK